MVLCVRIAYLTHSFVFAALLCRGYTAWFIYFLSFFLYKTEMIFFRVKIQKELFAYGYDKDDDDDGGLVAWLFVAVAAVH